MAGGAVTLNTSLSCGVSWSLASKAAVVSGVRMNWSTSRMKEAMKAAWGGWFCIAPWIRTGNHTDSVWECKKNSKVKVKDEVVTATTSQLYVVLKCQQVMSQDRQSDVLETTSYTLFMC